MAEETKNQETQTGQTNQAPIRTLTLAVTNTATYVEGQIDSQTYQGLKNILSYTPEDAYFRAKNIQQKKGWKWDGKVYVVCRDKAHCKCEIKKDGIHFPTGLYSKVAAYLKESNVAFKTIDKREKLVPNLKLEMSSEYEPRDYIEEFIPRAVNQTRAIIRASTGSGKCIGKDSLCLTELGMLSFDELRQEFFKNEPFSLEEFKTIDLSLPTPITTSGIDVATKLYYDGS